MRASLYLIGFAAASIVGAGVAEVGCSSSSTPATTPAEDGSTGTDSSTTVEDTGTGGDAAPATCTPMSINSETFDSGSDTWAALQVACKTQLTACAANCYCNNAILTALQCSAPDAAAAMGCFTTALTAIVSTDSTDESAVGSCLIANTSTGDGGAASDAGDAATTTSDAATDAAATDSGDGG
jgi:hypothetical protein